MLIAQGQEVDQSLRVDVLRRRRVQLIAQIGVLHSEAIVALNLKQDN